MGKHNLYWQFLRALEREARIGSSKHAARIASGVKNPRQIFSLSYLHDCKRIARYFCDYMREMHPEVKTMSEAYAYLSEFITFKANGGMKVTSQHMYASCLAKAYGCSYNDYHPLPLRSRDDITRSRGEAARDAEFNEAAHQDLIDFCCGVGCRREDVEENMRAGAYYYGDSGTLYVHVAGSKGGLDRDTPVSRKYQIEVAKRLIEAEMHGGPNARIFRNVSGKADIHGYRRDYAHDMYEDLSNDHAYRDLLYAEMKVEEKMKKKGPKGERYHCRGSARGQSFDRKSLQIIAVALGHGAGRENVVVNNYLLDTLNLGK